MSADIFALLDQHIADLETKLAALRGAREALTAFDGAAPASKPPRQKRAARAANGHGKGACSACGKTGHNKRSCKAAEDD